VGELVLGGLGESQIDKGRFSSFSKFRFKPEKEVISGVSVPCQKSIPTRLDPVPQVELLELERERWKELGERRQRVSSYSSPGEKEPSGDSEPESVELGAGDSPSDPAGR